MIWCHKKINSGRGTCCPTTITVHATNQSQSNRFCIDRNSRYIWPKRFCCDAYNSNGIRDFICWCTQPKHIECKPKKHKQNASKAGDTSYDLFRPWIANHIRLHTKMQTITIFRLWKSNQIYVFDKSNDKIGPLPQRKQEKKTEKTINRKIYSPDQINHSN